jgi:hypothetical protein
MEAKAERRGDLSWRLWALVPILLLAVAVGGYVASGSSLASLIGSNPPQPDQFDIRRVQFKPGEIRVRVTNPQQDDLRIASVTVDDAIVPFSLDGPQTLGRLRSSTIVIAYDWTPEDPISVGVTSSSGIETVEAIAAAVETPGGQRQRLSRLRDHRLPRWRAAHRARAALVAVAAPGRPAVADRVHGPDRGPALVPRRRGAVRGVPVAGSAPGSVRRARASCCSGWRRAS